MNPETTDTPRTTDVVEGADQNNEKTWMTYLRMITVEPTMFLYMMAFMITSVVEQAFFIDKACLVDLQFPENICENLTANETANTQVQVVVSTFHQYNDIASQVIPILLALFIGAWSDRRGRKLLLILGLLGKLWYSVWIVIISLQNSWGVNVIILAASLPAGITGADLSIFAASFSYLSDMTTIKDRTVRVTILDVTYLVSMPMGIALGKLIYNSIANHSYTIMFSINAFLLLLALLYSLVRLEWASTPQQRPLKICCLNTTNKLKQEDATEKIMTNESEISRNNCINDEPIEHFKEINENRTEENDPCCLVDFFDKEHLIQSVKTILRSRPNHGRTFLIILIIALGLYTFQRDERQMSYLYTHLKFHWNVDKFSDFRTFQSSLYVVGTLLCIPFMGKILKLSDTTMIMIGAASHAIARVVYASAKVPWLFYLGAGISCLGPVVAPVLRSMASKIVPTSERGKVFAMLSVADSTVPLFSGIVYTQVYNSTIYTYPSAIYWVTVGTQMVVFFSALGIKIALGKKSLESCAHPQLITNS